MIELRDMGLDQYLKARKYVGAWDHQKDDTERKQYDAIIMAAGHPGFRCDGSPHLYVEVNVAYWRKANQIHAWFVSHVQDGNDDCKDYYVSRDQLEELRDLCKTVLAGSKLVPGTIHTGTTYEGGKSSPILQDGRVVENPAVATELLPTESGFFFGGTEYDEYYIGDLKNTVDQIDAALAAFDGWDFQYGSSW